MTSPAAAAAGSDAIGVDADALDPACDRIALAALIEDISLAGVTEVVNLFIVETGLRLGRMATADSRSGQLLREVHTLNGAAGVVGAIRLGAIAAELEARLRVGGSMNAGDVGAMTAAFDAYVAQVCDMVEVEPAAE
jgi:chemotaxis protein histidine kinase CheA